MQIISEFNQSNLRGAGENYLGKLESAARLQGIPIIQLNRKSKERIGIELDYSRKKFHEEIGVWLGFVPSFKDYELVYYQLLERGIKLINSPAEFKRAEYFDEFYPFIKEETIKSGVAINLEDAKLRAKELEYPIFIKGAIQSLKKIGWEKCVAKNENELESIWKLLQENQDYSLNKAILRELVEFEYEGIGGNGIPQSHEYRYLMYEGEIIDKSNYWSSTKQWKITSKEEREIGAMIKRASKKVNVPYISIDVGKLKTGEWIIIEIGDGQFSDIRDISAMKLWNWLNVKLEKNKA